MNRAALVTCLFAAVAAAPAQAILPEQAARLQGRDYCRADWQQAEAARALTAQECIDEIFAGKCGPGAGGTWGPAILRTSATGLEVHWGGDPVFWEPLTTRDRACRYPLWLDTPPRPGSGQSADCAIATTALQKVVDATGCQVDPRTGALMHREGSTRDVLCQGLNYVDRYGIYMGQACRCAPGIRRGDYSLEQMQRLAVTGCASIR